MMRRLLTRDFARWHFGAAIRRFRHRNHFRLATSGQRNVTRQTINKALTPTLRMTLQFNSGLIQIKGSLLDLDGLV